jgi:predicted ArsR family transcriptional regulator
MPHRLTPTRREILTTLKKRGELTAAELAAVLNVTPVAARQQLSHLTAADLVEHRMERRPVGRPAIVYTLTKEADELFPKNYDDFAASLLQQIVELDGEEKLSAIFRARAAHLEVEYLPKLKSRRLGHRVAALAGILNEDGALAEWRPIHGGYELCAYNCVLAKIAPSFPQACAEELALFSRVLQARVERIEHMASGDRRCAYRITPRHQRIVDG